MSPARALELFTTGYKHIAWRPDLVPPDSTFAQRKVLFG